MILSDKDIAWQLANGQLWIGPLEDDQIQPASVDVTMSRLVRRSRATHGEMIKTWDPDTDAMFHPMVDEGAEIVLDPWEFVLASTKESVRLPGWMAARLEGKSSLARLGLLVHTTAGFIDPGFEGHLTLEMHNVSQSSLVIRPGQRIAQVSFLMTTSPVVQKYGSDGLGSHYQNQGPEPTVSEGAR